MGGPVLFDQARLDALARTWLMGAGAEEVFDRLTRMASRLIGAPAGMSLVDDRREHFTSRADIDVHEVPLSHSLSQHVVSDGEALVVADTRRDARLRENLAVRELGVLAYAGVPLAGPDGHTLGAFWAIDRTPRQWSADDIELLTELAASAMTEIELRMAIRELGVRETEVRSRAVEHHRDHLASIVGATQDAISTIDRDGFITSWNDGAERLYGFTAAEMIGHRPLPTENDPADETGRLVARALQGTSESVHGIARRHKSGELIYIDMSVAPMRDEHDAITGATAIARDVTEQRRLELELEASERRFRATFDDAPNGLIIVAPDRRLLRVNRAFSRMTGYATEELVGRTLDRITHPDDFGNDHVEIGRTLAGEIPGYEFDKRYVHRTGHSVHVHLSVSLVRGDDGAPGHFVAHVEDVTAAREAEAALLEGRRLLDESQAVAQIGSWSYNLETHETSWSDAQFRLYGLQPAPTAPDVERILDIIHPEDRERVRVSFARLVANPRGFADEFRVCPEPGQTRTLWVRADLLAADPANGRAARVTGTSLDVTVQREADWHRRALEERQRQLLTRLPDTLVTLYDRNLRCTAVEGALLGELGITPEQFEGRLLEELTPAGQLAELKPHMLRALEGESATFDYPGTMDRVFEVAVAPYHGEHDAIVGVFTVWRNITARVREQEARRDVEERLRVTVEHAPIGVALIDLGVQTRGRLLSVNAAFTALIAEPDPVAARLSLVSLVHPDDADGLRDELTLLSTDGLARTETEARCLRPDGTTIWLLLTGAAVPSPHGSPKLAVVHALDIGERKRFEGQLQYLADHDALTGLLNRRRFEGELARAVSLADRYDHPTALLMVDLDGFKHVNDTMGHSHGDELVTRIGSTLRATMRDTDVIGRLGGDEFAVILTNADLHEATVVSDKLLRAIAHHAVVTNEDGRAAVTASVGITVFDKHTGLDAGELMIEADVAMYRAKDAGRNQLAVFARELTSGQTLTPRQSWQLRLRTALEENQFELYAQPIRGMHSDGIERFELLLRLQGEDGELLTPGTFLYNAERFDLIQQIDRWVFAQAAEMLGVCAAAGRDVSLSVNMSGKTLRDPEVIVDLQAIVAHHPIPPGRLVVEVTETAAIVNIDKAREVARGLRELGCRFALDDFGAGFASLYYLKHLDFDFVKIDGDFVKSLSVNATDQLVIKSVVDIARGLGAETIAELVEDGDTLRRLTDLGVDYVQGYHLGRPAPVAQMLPELGRSPAR